MLLESLKGKAEWGFWIDADEQLIIDETFNKPKLKEQLKNFDSASTMVHYGNQNYFRSQLFRADFPWKWKGAVHEILVPSRPINARGSNVKGFHTLVTPDGNSWGDGSKEAQIKKYQDHVELLKEYIKTDDDVRWLFYLAQSYRDCFDYANAEKWYNERLKHQKGYWEELYFSALMVASAKAAQNKPISEVIDAYTQCSKYDCGRGEHYLPVIKYHQSKGNWPTAYIISKFCYEKYAGKNPFPKSSLFIEKSTYDWAFFDLHCLSAYYVGRMAEARSCYNKLRKAINKGLVSEADSARIKKQEKWYSKKQEQDMAKKGRPHYLTI